MTRHSETISNTLSVVGVTLAQMSDHPLLRVRLALPERRDEVEDQIVALPRFEAAIPLTSLSVVVGAAKRLPADLTGYVRCVRRSARGAFARRDARRRLVVHVRIDAG
jgi:hypothetical protein